MTAARDDEKRRPRPARSGQLAAAALAALGLLACGGAGGPPAPPNLLLVTVDTLRADRVEREAPFLTSLGERGVRAARAYATAPWTLPSMASLVTGAWPAVHRVEQSTVLRGEVIAQEVLPDALPVLAERLRDAGYATFGLTANQSLAPEFGFGRGFERYACLGFEDDGAVLLERLEAWLPEIRAREPWFVWLHFLDPHAPYLAREPWFSQRWPRDRRYPALVGVAPAPVYRRLGIGRGGPKLAFVEALYASEVSRTDALLREAFERLDPEGRAFALVTADHGEEFLEHDHFGHGFALFEESLRVPLVVRLPGARLAGRVVESPVSLVDVMPTLLAAAGLTPPPDAPGRDLVALAARPDAAPPRALFARLWRKDRASAVIEGRWKLVDERRPTARRTLRDLAADPEERQPAAADAAREARLGRLLEEHEREAEASRGEPNRIYPLTPEQAEALRDLGYAD